VFEADLAAIPAQGLVQVVCGAWGAVGVVVHGRNPAQAGREREPVGRRKEPPHVLHGARPRAGFLISLNPWAGQYRVYDRYGGRVPSMVGVDGWEGRLRRWEKREGAGAVLW
jgi:hypothetical protein